MLKLSFRVKHFVNAVRCFDFFVASNKGAFLGLKDLEADTYYDVKFTRNSGVNIPNVEGLYFVEADESKVWLDKREGKRPTIWIADANVKLTKWEDHKTK